MPTKCCWVIHGRLTSERKASTSPSWSSFINHSTMLLDRALKRHKLLVLVHVVIMYMNFDGVRALDRLRTRCVESVFTVQDICPADVIKIITIGLEIGLNTKITFWSLLKVPFKRIFWWKLCEKIQWRSCHQSCLVALVFCTKLYIKLAVSLCSFSQFSFPFNFRTANALVLKFGTLPLTGLFSNTLLAIFDILFRSRVIYRFVPKNGPKLTCGRVFQHNFISKAILKNPEQVF